MYLDAFKQTLELSRREILARAAALAAVSAVPGAAFAAAKGGKARIVIVGAGVGGATAAKYLKMFNKDLM